MRLYEILKYKNIKTRENVQTILHRFIPNFIPFSIKIWICLNIHNLVARREITSSKGKHARRFDNWLDVEKRFTNKYPSSRRNDHLSAKNSVREWFNSIRKSCPHKGRCHVRSLTAMSRDLPESFHISGQEDEILFVLPFHHSWRLFSSNAPPSPSVETHTRCMAKNVSSRIALSVRKLWKNLKRLREFNSLFNNRECAEAIRFNLRPRCCA